MAMLVKHVPIVSLGVPIWPKAHTPTPSCCCIFTLRAMGKSFCRCANCCPWLESTRSARATADRLRLSRICAWFKGHNHRCCTCNPPPCLRAPCWHWTDATGEKTVVTKAELKGLLLRRKRTRKYRQELMDLYFTTLPFCFGSPLAPLAPPTRNPTPSSWNPTPSSSSSSPSNCLSDFSGASWPLTSTSSTSSSLAPRQLDFDNVSDICCGTSAVVQGGGHVSHTMGFHDMPTLSASEAEQWLASLGP